MIFEFCSSRHGTKLWFSLIIIIKIWALQDGTTVVIGGKTNRAKLEFPDEMNRMLDRVPELVGIDGLPNEQ